MAWLPPRWKSVARMKRAVRFFLSEMVPSIAGFRITGRWKSNSVRRQGRSVVRSGGITSWDATAPNHADMGEGGAGKGERLLRHAGNRQGRPSAAAASTCWMWRR